MYTISYLTASGRKMQRDADVPGGLDGAKAEARRIAARKGNRQVCLWSSSGHLVARF